MGVSKIIGSEWNKNKPVNTACWQISAFVEFANPRIRTHFILADVVLHVEQQESQTGVILTERAGLACDCRDWRTNSHWATMASEKPNYLVLESNNNHYQINWYSKMFIALSRRKIFLHMSSSLKLLFYIFLIKVAYHYQHQATPDILDIL